MYSVCGYMQEWKHSSLLLGKYLTWNYRETNIKAPLTARPQNVKRIISQRVKSLMKYIAREENEGFGRGRDLVSGEWAPNGLLSRSSHQSK